MNRTKKLQNISICLEALDLYHRDHIIKHINNKIENINQKNNNRCSNYLHSTSLSSVTLLGIIHEMLLKNDAKDKICAIVTNYSSHQKYGQEFSLITVQYLSRFIHKYKIYYKYKYYSQIKNFRLKKQIQNAAILSLYILHRVLLKESLYFLYEYLKI